MAFGETKVYFDGSHYIAIPHTERRVRKRPKPPEEVITVVEENAEGLTETPQPSFSFDETVDETDPFEAEVTEEAPVLVKEKPARKTTKKQLFDELYKQHINLSRKQREKAIVKKMLPYFKEANDCEYYVAVNMERKQRNLICRRIRMIRKANLVNFNYFCTFTYNDKKHDENTFRKSLKKTFQNLAVRKGWKYMGVWERAPETKRLHFHGLFSIPHGAMVGELIDCNDYNFKAHRRIKTVQNSYFNERFGRSDFEEINTHRDLMQEIQYICKYLEKTEEKIVYSKGLYQYFISDIYDDDIVCTIGQEDKKLLLFDNFMCSDEGLLMGRVTPEIIAKMRKCN